MTDHDKKISGVEAPMNPVQQQAGPSEGRRRLMKGALAAPAVMTLMNGRLAAAASMTCDMKLDGLNPTAGWTNGSITLELRDGELGYDDGTSFIKLSSLTDEELENLNLNNFLPHSCYTSLHPNSG